jgi:hypothetical protein
LCSARDKALANPFLLGDDAPQPTRRWRNELWFSAQK